MTEKKNDIRARRARVGLCEKCGALPRSHAWGTGRYDKLLERRVEAGLCIDCGLIADRDRLRCRKCARREAERKLARRRELLGTEPSKRRCAECRKVGHTVRTCPKASKL